MKPLIVSASGIVYTPVHGSKYRHGENMYRIKGDMLYKKYTYEELTRDGQHTFRSQLPMFFKRISDGIRLYRGIDDKYTFGNIGGKRFSYNQVMKSKLFEVL